MRSPFIGAQSRVRCWMGRLNLSAGASAGGGAAEEIATEMAIPLRRIVSMRWVFKKMRGGRMMAIIACTPVHYEDAFVRRSPGSRMERAVVESRFDSAAGGVARRGEG